MSEPGTQETKPTSTPADTGVSVEITQPVETDSGLKQGEINIRAPLYQLADGSIFSGSQKDAIQANEGVMEKGTKI